MEDFFQAVAKPFAMYSCTHMHTSLSWAVTFPPSAWMGVPVFGDHPSDQQHFTHSAAAFLQVPWGI